MNKTKVNDLLPKAYEVLKETGIANSQNVIQKTYRGYISTFGAAVSGGSLLAAIAFYSDNKDAQCDRVKLLKALYLLVQDDKNVRENSLFRYVADRITTEEKGKKRVDSQKEAACREKIMDAAIALKLAMNLYKLSEEQESGEAYEV